MPMKLTETSTWPCTTDLTMPNVLKASNFDKLLCINERAKRERERERDPFHVSGRPIAIYWMREREREIEISDNKLPKFL